METCWPWFMAWEHLTYESGLEFYSYSRRINLMQSIYSCGIVLKLCSPWWWHPTNDQHMQWIKTLKRHLHATPARYTKLLSHEITLENGVYKTSNDEKEFWFFFTKSYDRSMTAHKSHVLDATHYWHDLITKNVVCLCITTSFATTVVSHEGDMI